MNRQGLAALVLIAAAGVGVYNDPNIVNTSYSALFPSAVAYGPPAPPKRPPQPDAPRIVPTAAITIGKPQPKLVEPASIIAPERKQKQTGLPPCSVVRNEYARMTFTQQMAAYISATPEQVAHGKRCLGIT